MESGLKEKVEEFLHKKDILKELRRRTAAGQKSLVVSFEDILEFDKELAKRLLDSPSDFFDTADAILESITKIVGMRLRVKSLPDSIEIRNIRAEHVGKFIQVEGILTRTSEVKPEAKEAVFKCRYCGEENKVLQVGELFRQPLSCENPNCRRKGAFDLIIESTVFRDWQSLCVQEPPEKLRGGRMPQKLDGIVRDDFVDKAVPGNHITLTGVLRVFQERQRRERRTTFRKILFVSHIEVRQKGVEETELTEEDEKKIKELAKDPWLRNKIIQSIIPAIHGCEAIKEAVALQLFGCNPTVLPDGTRIRGDTHILLCGDPGCLIADERIVLGNGAIMKIGDLGSEHLQPLEQQVLTGQGYRRALATRFHVYHDQPILEVVTETGKSIKGTFNHPLLVIEKQGSRQFPCPPVRVWKRLDEIKPGDRVAVVPWIPCSITAHVETKWRPLPRKYGPRSKCKLPAKLDGEVAAVLGYILGDGWVRRTRVGFNINNEEKDLLLPLSSIIKRKFGLDLRVREVKLKNSNVGKREIIRKHPLLEAELHSVDVAANLHFLREKRVPDIIMKSGNQVVAEFLAWLFEADGCVFSNGRGRRGIQLKSKNIELLRDVQILLLRFGIHSRINGDNLMIRRAKSIFKFSESIGFRSKKKRAKLADLVAYCRTLRKCRGKQLSERVIAVRPVGRADVYDIEVPDGHRFIANGIISHNTAKSQILKWISNVAPRGLYTSGMKSTGAGLTAAAVRDEISGGWGLEAGALVIADGGLASIDEFEKMNKEEAAAILESMEQQSYHPSMEVLLADGKKVRIGKFVDDMFGRYPNAAVDGINCEILPLPTDVKVFTLDLTGGDVRRTRVNRVSRHIAPEKFIRLTYSNGRSIVVTPEHPVFVWKDRSLTTIPAEKVMRGDFVPAPRMVPNSTEEVCLPHVEKCYRTEKEISLPEVLTPRLAGIAGLLVTEGCFYEPYEVSFSNRERRLLNEMRQLMKREFGIVPGVRVNADTGVVFQRYNSVRLYKWFKRNFSEIVTRAASKRIPAKIMGASREIAREFLRAAFLGDGSVESTGVCYRTKSQGLAEDYQDLLLKLSINSRLLADKSNGSFKVYIAGDSLDKFLREVVSKSDSRAEKIREIVEKSRRVSRHHDCLPTGVAKEIKDLLKVAGLPYNGYFQEHFESKYGITREVVLSYVDELRKKFGSLLNAQQTANTISELRLACGYSQARVARLLGVKRGTIDYVERGGYTEAQQRKLLADFKLALSREIGVALSRLKKIEELASWRWLRVKKVETMPNDGQMRTEWVYDITVEPTHCFVNHGLILHNTISVAKAGIVATLNTRTAVLAATNPKLGRFEKNIPPAQQLALDPVLLSRFDLVLLLRDEPRADYDHSIAQHVLQMHTAPKKVVKAPFDPEFLRKIIIYARKYVDPKIEDKEVSKTIEKFFVDWRKVATEGAPLPITVRQLEALIRLAKSNARMRLSNRVTVEDANRAINLIKTSLREAGIDTEANVVDIDLIMTGIPKSQREKRQRVFDIIKELEEQYGGAAPIEKVKVQARAHDIREEFVDWMIDEEKKRGYLYSPTPETVSRAVK